jgi:glycosyltransferase involved in cell wall biosynthesis
MRILHVSALPVWSMKGEGGMPSLRQTLDGHRRAGHSVTLVLPAYDIFSEGTARRIMPTDASKEDEVAPCRWFPAMLQVRTLAKRMNRGQLPYAARWLLNVGTWLLLTVSLLLAGLRLRYRRKRRFDLVYAHNQYAAIAGWLLGGILGVPNVTRLYGTFLADLMRRPLVWLRYPVAAGGFLVPHSLLICGNDGTRGDEVAKRLRIDLAKFRFWQNGVDKPDVLPTADRRLLSATVPPNLRPQARWVFTCSRLSYWKRIDRILHAGAYGRRAGADCQILVAGDGPERANLESLAGELGIASDVVWLGAVPHGRIWQWLVAADVFIIANDVTNRCNPLYEAICAGLPVVSLRDPSTADLLTHGENSLLADRTDGEDLGRCLRQTLSDDGLASAMRQAQRRRAATFQTWAQRMAMETDELEALIARSAGKGMTAPKAGTIHAN